MAGEAARGGRSRVQGGKYEEAIELAKKAAELDPKNPAAPFVVGSAHLALRQNDEAVKAFTDAHRTRPEVRRRLRPPRRRLPEDAASSRRPSPTSTSSSKLRPEVRPGPLAARHRAVLRRPVRGRPQAVRPAPHGEPGGRGELGLALPVQRPREHAQEGPRGPDPGDKDTPRADEAGARTVRRASSSRRTCSTRPRTRS